MSLLDESGAYDNLYQRFPEAKRQLFEALEIWRDQTGHPVKIYKHNLDHNTFNQSIIEIDGILLRYRWSSQGNLHAWYVLYVDSAPGERGATVRPYQVSCGHDQYGIDAESLKMRLKQVTKKYGITALDPMVIKVLLKL
ncbi:hypothetical protein IT415_02170 [bacterium]|nr:hypothetical protein [bacterium]